MRPDMAKVVTEAPRHGSGERNHKSRARVHPKDLEVSIDGELGADGDFGPKKLKMSPHVRTGRGYAEGKTFSDVLGPLQKFLRKQVGRPWDKVYSELSATLDKRSVSGLHIWDHVWQFVERHCYEVDGQVYRKPDNAWRWYRPTGTVTGLYIHPRTGLLCFAKERPRYRRPRGNPDVIEIDKFTKLERLHGLWYFTWYAAVDRWRPERKGKYVNVPGAFEEELVLQRKKQLSRAELKAQGLHNGAPDLHRKKSA